MIMPIQEEKLVVNWNFYIFIWKILEIIWSDLNRYLSKLGKELSNVLISSNLDIDIDVVVDVDIHIDIDIFKWPEESSEMSPRRA